MEGTEASLSYIQCFLYLVSSLINVSIFHITWLATFWTDLVYPEMELLTAWACPTPCSQLGLRQHHSAGSSGENLGTILDFCISYSAWAAITKQHRRGGLNKRNLFSHYFGGWKCQRGWVLVRGLSLACRWLPSRCVLWQRGSGSSLVPLRRKALIPP